MARLDFERAFSHLALPVYQITQLTNGLRIATAEMPHMVGVSVGLWVGVGSRFETAAYNGACHFIEHLLFKGTKTRSARDISQAVEGVGGYLNAFTSEEVTCFHARACHDRFPVLLEVLVDMAVNSVFDPVEIAKEREVIKEEMAMYLDEPQHHVQELLNATLWPGQPLGRPITGTNRSLDGLGRTQLLGFLRGHYVTANTLIVAAGKVTHRQAVRAVSRFARGFRTGAPPACAPASSRQHAPKVHLFTKRTEQTQIALGLRTCSRRDDRRYPLRLLNTILGENMSSRLFQIVREDHGLAYSIYSTPSFFSDTGDLVIAAGMDTGNVDRTLRLIRAELRRLTECPPSAGELRRARDYVFGQINLGQENTDNQMNWVGEQILGYGDVLSPEAVKRRLARVTAADIRAVARDFFRPENLNLAVVSPLKKPHALERALV
jgi:predicted Zn-dependent peptidase